MVCAIRFCASSMSAPLMSGSGITRALRSLIKERAQCRASYLITRSRIGSIRALFCSVDSASAVDKVSATALTHVSSDRHCTTLGVYPIGSNGVKFEKTLNSAEFHRRREQFHLAHKGKRLVVSVERMDYTKGIL